MEPTKYRKKPVVIEAWQWLGLEPGKRSLKDVSKFLYDWGCPACFDDYDIISGTGMLPWSNPELSIVTLEGVMHVSKGDYILKGVEGEFYSCKPSVFAKTYESVEVEELSDAD